MNNKMKIIDLINKIVKGEEVPRKIKWGCHNFIYSNIYKDYIAKDEFGIPKFLEFVVVEYEVLNDEVEILDNEDEEKKIPEKMDRELNCDDDTVRGLVASVNEIYKEIADKYNEIIDYLKSKGDE